jgi:hypothetical protein
VLTVLPWPVWAQQPVANPETLIRLNLRPMAAPKPALRYLLLPELKEMAPGNPIPNYLKCVLAQEITSDEFMVNKMSLKDADRAARMDKPDWQILLKCKTDGIGLLLPDVQKMRQLAASLQERLREEAGRRQFDDAIVTAKTMFALSRHMGDHPTLIGELVGIAIAQVAITPFEEMLEQPGCPNFFWALTNLPHPFIPLDNGMQGERMLITGELNDLDAVRPMNREQLKKVIQHIDRIREIAQDKKEKSTREWLDEHIKDKAFMEAARQRLLEAGFSEERFQSFPPEQFLLLSEKVGYEIRRDDEMKYMNLPDWQADEIMAKFPTKAGPGLFDILVPSLRKVRQASMRLSQRFALLRHVEAIRMYAAEHDGKLPEKLADIALPLPVDPVTGKSFRYNLEGTTAHLRGSPAKGMEMNVAFNLHYEITIQK